MAYRPESVEAAAPPSTTGLTELPAIPLQALVQHLDDMSEEEVIDLNIPTGIPLVYELDESLHPMRHYYLGDAEAVAAAAAAVAAQGRAQR